MKTLAKKYWELGLLAIFIALAAIFDLGWMAFPSIAAALYSVAKHWLSKDYPFIIWIQDLP